MSPHFVVMGVPRSGTGALADALNLHPEIMCGFEYFGHLGKASKAESPAAFEDPRIIQRLYAYLCAGPDEHAMTAFKDRIFAPAGKSRDDVVEEACAVYDQLGLADAEARTFVRPVLLRDCCEAVRAALGNSASRP